MTHFSATSRAAASDDARRPSHVRGEDAALAALIDEGERRSAVFQGLVEQLNQSDVFVYVQQRELAGNLNGRLTLIGASRPWRYLRVQIDCRRMLLAQIAALGHELQHAVEIAGTPGAVSGVFLQQMFTTIGYRLEGVGQRYETDSAREAGRRVFRQLFSPGGRTEVTELRQTGD